MLTNSQRIKIAPSFIQSVRQSKVCILGINVLTQALAGGIKPRIACHKRML